MAGATDKPISTGFVLHPTYRVRRGRPVIQIFGRLDGGGPFLVEDDRFRPYFFVPARDAASLATEPDVAIEASPLQSLTGDAVARIVATLPSVVPGLREKLLLAGIPVYEGDVRFPYRYLIDRGIRGGVTIEGGAEDREGALVRFRNPTLRAATVSPRLSLLSIDLETAPDASRIYCAALVGNETEEVHLTGHTSVPGARIHPDERHLLEGLIHRIREIDPDVVLGWNVVDFDLRVLARRCRELALPCALGRRGDEPVFQQDRSFTRQSRAVIEGRMVLDGIGLVRDALRLEDYRLETVARAVLGRGKLIDSETPDTAAEISRLYREDPAALVAYNLEDARLVLEILEREGLVELALERSLLCGMQLDRVGASIASFDLLYLPELRKRKLVASSVDLGRKSAPVRGGAVLDSEPGLFRNVAVFDFRSLYPSLIRTFNLDPLAHARAAEDAVVAPNGARFSRSEAILPEIIERFIDRRERAKQRGDRHADQAIKIMMNALFGVLGAAACRFFDPDIANAITSFGQQMLGWTREAFEERGVQVLYGDTDSVFVKLSDAENDTSPRDEAETLREAVESRIRDRVRRDYAVEPRLTLELERIFERFFMPRVRRGSSGSKKRYAGLCGGRLEVVGLESVRRDWPAVAKRLQEGMLSRLFSDREIMPYVREVVSSLQRGEIDDELVYVKRVRKGSLDRYTATTPPHIQAARKLSGPPGRVVRYVIAETGPEPVLLGRALPDRIDRGHYLERVLRPVADAILTELDQSFDEALGRPRQMKLL